MCFTDSNAIKKTNRGGTPRDTKHVFKNASLKLWSKLQKKKKRNSAACGNFFLHLDSRDNVLHVAVTAGSCASMGSVLHEFAGGTVGGVMGMTIVYPLDTVKSRYLSSLKV